MDQPVFQTELQLQELSNAAQQLLKAGKAKIFLFDAPMGAGKTTLIKEMCKTIGSDDHFSSPTYSIINEYGYPGGKIYHLDLYRVKNTEELMDLGIEEYLDSGEYCMIEWPGLAEALVEGDYLKVQIEINGERRVLKAFYIQE